ncbi:MAG: PaaI family thioesterase [Paracoccaceae bacterium]|jgi:acyl-coenzyme A thioesterase PaaI-like protein
MPQKKTQALQAAKERRDAALQQMASSVPYINFLGVEFERRGDELTTTLPFTEMLIGNPFLPALHGGTTAAFLEITAVMELMCAIIWPQMEKGGPVADAIARDEFPSMPKTIDFTVDYLRTGLPRDAYARARVNRSGRRYASVHVEAWQDDKNQIFAQATGHFLMPELIT